MEGCGLERIWILEEWGDVDLGGVAAEGSVYGSRRKGADGNGICI